MFSAITLALLFLYADIFVMSLIGMFVFTVMRRNRLRTHHADVWAELGSGIGLQCDSWGLWSWVWARRYDDLGDAAMVRLTLLHRICASVFIGSAVVGTAAVLVSKLFHVGGI